MIGLKVAFEALERLGCSFNSEEAEIYDKEMDKLNYKRSISIVTRYKGLLHILNHIISDTFGEIPKEFLSMIE
jgi:hypothetical protein